MFEDAEEARIVFNAIEQTLFDRGIAYSGVIEEFGQVSASTDRSSGKQFGANDHVRGLVMAMLSNQRPWRPIADNRARIAAIFQGFDPQFLSATDPLELVRELRAIRCGNRRITYQMDSLSDNIRNLEMIAKIYGSLDLFVESSDPFSIAHRLSDAKSDFKLKEIGIALACEYLKNVGIRASKPDSHMRRLVSADRLGLIDSPSPTELQAYGAIGVWADLLGENATYVDNILWLFCATGYGNVCGASPNCSVCRANSHCRFPFQRISPNLSC